MPLDPLTATGLVLPEQQFCWNEADTRRYRHAVGRSEWQTGVLPTFAMTAPGAFGVASPEFYHSRPPEIRFPGIRLRLATLLQQEQQLRVHAPLPPTGSARCRGEVLAIENRGGAAVLVQRTELVGADGTPLVSGTSRIHARGEGTAGGSTVRPKAAPPPASPADAEVLIHTDEQQAVRYQHCGKNNSLHGNVHTDAAFARAAGLAGPIMQGVCTYGMVCAALIDTVLGADITRVRGFSGRFTGIVFPGESLHVRIWTGAGEHRYLTTVPERGDAPVLTGVLRW
ncbi:3-alpha,7-alpha,12-alpha-trihydroxy-5-beta-cholest-24-enoyl-CoA hydratase [Nocardia zapadnayensis]|uniref:MaoC/PaaZ C-terminal domain-containing protein n=1 Tax=Nocardia rhamnosiphila TaxID=426716 RepID=UPI0022473C28|nr:MaoC/PaaZ C-terminal domain-containing protein [Nocardia zapadnayensis]MCX0272545.1 3-alpha,7-alpha,12-alpha-trihydroxy-5-beta-cholest-24-enoyl-CoA hydratase [Nocardia zapadnayensis]